MEHNTFDFIVTCSGDRNYPANYYLYDYFTDCAESDNAAFEVEGMAVQESGIGLWTVTFKLVVRDYGIAQIGMHLVGAYLRSVYEPIYEGETEFIIDECVFYHTTGRGARIDWDDANSKPIIERVDREGTETEEA